MSGQNWLRGRTVIYNPAQRVQKGMPWYFKALTLFMKILSRTCLILGAIVLFFIVSIYIGLKQISYEEGSTAVQKLPAEMVLMLDLDGSLPEKNAKTEYVSLLGWDRGTMVFEDVIDALHQAETDPRVKVLAAHMSGGGYDLAQAQQIRAAIKKFRATGKKAYIYSESYGDGSSGLAAYYIASAFDEIWMQPVGVVSIGGMKLESPYFKKIMDKHGVEAQIFQRKEYKNAMEHITAAEMSPASREMMSGLINDLASQMVEPIKADRKKVSKNFNQLIDLGLITDKEALKQGLIDRLGYEDELYTYLKKSYCSCGFVYLSQYAGSIKNKRLEQVLLRKYEHENTVAVIHVDGMIVSGRVEESPYGFQEKMSGGDDIADAIYDAARDPLVDRIVLRVNSPGGSPSASETIYRAVVWAQSYMKKDIYVSMGSYAASGGYWVSAGAKKIYALDSTLTGSIGVVGGKVNLDKLWQKYDVNWDSVQYGKNAGMMSMNTPFSPSEQRQFEASLDNVYAYFIDHVAKGRKLKPEQVEEVARGHIWTGKKAKQLGLVDEIGGLDKVLDDVAKEMRLSSRDELNIVHMPSLGNPLDIFYDLLSSEVVLPPALRKTLIMMQPFLASSEQGQRLVYDPNVVHSIQ